MWTFLDSLQASEASVGVKSMEPSLQGSAYQQAYEDKKDYEQSMVDFISSHAKQKSDPVFESHAPQSIPSGSGHGQAEDDVSGRSLLVTLERMNPLQGACVQGSELLTN